MASRRWYFQGPKEEWFAYGEADVSVLEAAYSSDPRGKHHVKLGPHDFSYEVDLVTMVQRNAKTGMERLMFFVQEEPAVGTKELADIFAHFDKEGDGRISKEELTEVLSELGMARSTVRTLLSAADTDRSGDLDYREFVAWICGGSDIAEEVSSHFDMLVLQNRDGHSTVFIHPLDGHSASLKVPNGTLTRKVRERGDSWVVKYDGEDWLVKKYHALEAAGDVRHAGKGKGKGKAKHVKGVSCDPSIVAGAAAACKDSIQRMKDEGDWYEDESQEAWTEYNGSVLETALMVVEELGESPVRLVDARFIVELAKRSGRLPRRQDLPEECFISLEQLKRFPLDECRGDCLRVIAISHPWQQPDHPDPKSINLQILARVLSSFLDESSGTYAVFLDFLSVVQKGPNLEDRTPKERKLFSLALTNMMDWYGHPKIRTFKITKLPSGYPSGFDFPEGCAPNTAGYFDRGWCFCESSVSNLAKDSTLVLDLGKLSGPKTHVSELVKECTAQRRPPISPQQFTIELSTKSFTSKAADEKMVSNLYKKSFKAQLGSAVTLELKELAWGDEELAVLAQALAAEAMPKLVCLVLSSNQIGNRGCTALAEACEAGALPNLVSLFLDANKIGVGGCTALAKACAAGALPKLERLWLFNNQIGDGGCTALAKACAAGALPKLTVLYLSSNRIGDGGCTALAKACAVGALPNLTALDLSSNKISDGSCTALAEAFAAGALPELFELNLGTNQIGDGGCTSLAKACATGALPKLKTLWLPSNKIGEDCITSLGYAWVLEGKAADRLYM